MKVLLIVKRGLLERKAREIKNLPFHIQSRIKRVHIRHKRTIKVVESTLKMAGIVYEKCDNLKPRSRNYDMVISVGGDGIFFAASHFAKYQPILGVNSDPLTSIGLFTGATAKDFGNVFNKILSRKVKSVKLSRLSVMINNRRVKEFAINDVLLASTTPAVPCKYIITIDGKREEQKSSGLWISTPSGSTGAISSAGGKIMPLNSDKFQYLVREPLAFEKYKLKRGFWRKSIEVICLSHHSCIWIDGNFVCYRLNPGDVIKFLPDALPLNVLNFNMAKRNKLIKLITRSRH